MNTKQFLFLILSCLLLVVIQGQEANSEGEGGEVVDNTANTVDGTTSTADANQVLFDKLDSNHDHKLTLTDFYKLDTNHDEQISKQEFNAALGKKKSFTKQTFDEEETGGFWKGFTSSTAMIIATEIGDKTFFIAAVLSMRHSRLAVFSGAILALICMTILSTMMGLILPSLMPRQYTHIIGGVLFLYFGIKLIYDSKDMTNAVSEELEEVEEELGCNSKKNDKDIEANDTNENKKSQPKTEKNIFFQAFLLTFLAEWGDRSQIATIALAAAKDPYGVTLGACFGHSMCTGVATIGGRMLASRISEKTVSFWGGIIFLCFGVHALFIEE